MKRLLNILNTAFFILIGCVILGHYSAGNEVCAAYDTTAPKLNSVTLNKSKVVQPGLVNVTLDITEEETGVKYISIIMYPIKDNGEWDGYSCRDAIYDISSNQGSPLFSGKHTFTISIPNTSPSGKYGIFEIRLIDSQNNTSDYATESIWGDNGQIIDQSLKMKNFVGDEGDNCNINTFLTVIPEFDVNFQSYVTNPNVLYKLNSMPEGQACMINFDNSNCTAKKEWFDAIRGKNKTIVFSNDGIQWVFNGSDIVNDTKDIKLSANIEKVSGSAYGNVNDVLQIDFASNGVLPGKARIRVKSDYIYNLFSLKQAVNLYYINQTATLESSNINHIIDGSDHWCQFYITHNSRYVISAGKISYIANKKSKIGKSFIHGNYRYKITAKNEVTLVKSVNTNKYVNIKKSLSFSGKTYKITAIEAGAFKNNKKIIKVTLGSNVKTIGKQAFYGCKNLKSITIKSKYLTTKSIGAKAFTKAGSKNYKKLVVKVPKSKKKAYVKLLKKKGLSSKAKIK